MMVLIITVKILDSQVGDKILHITIILQLKCFTMKFEINCSYEDAIDKNEYMAPPTDFNGDKDLKNGNIVDSVAHNISLFKCSRERRQTSLFHGLN